MMRTLRVKFCHKSKEARGQTCPFPRTQSDFYYLSDTCTMLPGRIKGSKLLIGGNPFSSMFYIMMKTKDLPAENEKTIKSSLKMN